MVYIQKGVVFVSFLLVSFLAFMTSTSTSEHFTKLLLLDINFIGLLLRNNVSNNH